MIPLEPCQMKECVKVTSSLKYEKPIFVAELWSWLLWTEKEMILFLISLKSSALEWWGTSSPRV